jgi:hypothetical protein
MVDFTPHRERKLGPWPCRSMHCSDSFRINDAGQHGVLDLYVPASRSRTRVPSPAAPAVTLSPESVINTVESGASWAMLRWPHQWRRWARQNPIAEITLLPIWPWPALPGLLLRFRIDALSSAGHYLDAHAGPVHIGPGHAHKDTGIHQAPPWWRFRGRLSYKVLRGSTLVIPFSPGMRMGSIDMGRAG